MADTVKVKVDQFLEGGVGWSSNVIDVPKEMWDRYELTREPSSDDMEGEDMLVDFIDEALDKIQGEVMSELTRLLQKASSVGIEWDVDIRDIEYTLVE